MRAILSLLLVIAIIFAGYYFLLRQTGAVSGGSPTTVITTAGVENDLLAIAQAQRVYVTQHDGYGSLDQLVQSGALTMDRRGRDGYIYTVRTSSSGFTVTAKPDESRSGSQPTLVIDQNMEIRRLP